MRLLLATIGLALFTTPVFAACVQQDGAGIWKLYANTTDNAGDTEWVRCTLKLKNTGRLRASSKCTTSDGGTESISGRIRVRTSCRVHGNLTVDPAGAAETLTIVDGQLSPDHAVMAGVGTDTDGNFTFIGIRE